MPTARLYYEAHITLEPVFGDRLELARFICKQWGFKVADLLMQKRLLATPERSTNDTFATGHGKDYEDLANLMRGCIAHLISFEFKVWRYKIEDTLLDSRHDGDVLNAGITAKPDPQPAPVAPQ